MRVPQDERDGLLTTPKCHHRTDSGNSHNYSLLDYYDMETVMEPQDDVYGLPTNETQLDEPYVAPDNIHYNGNAELESLTEDPTESGSVDAPMVKYTSNGMAPDSLTFSQGPTIASPDSSRIKQILESDTDMYGFLKNSSLFDSSVESYNEWFGKYSAHFISQKKKWDILMKSSGLSTQANPNRFPPKSAKVKKLIRRGIPPEWRGNAWFFYAGGYEKLNKNIGVYKKIANDTKGIKNKDTEIIERDLNRTFPDNVLFKQKTTTDHQNSKDTEMISTLRRVLVAFAHYQPQVGYCQSLNFIAGLLLLFMSEECAFWMLVIMTERIIPKVHSTNLEGVHTDQGVLMMCIKEYIPKLWAVIGRAPDGTVLKEDKILTRLPPLTLVTSSWFMSVFIGSLPIESVLRIWDIIWYEGSKTIFRISLTICRLCFDHPTFQANRDVRHSGNEVEVDQIELFQFIQNFPKSLTDPNLLIDLCFKKIGGYGYGFLSQDEINKCREFVAYQRNKIESRKKGVLGAQMSDQEREALRRNANDFEDVIHDVYGFNNSIMSGVAWNKHISGMMKKKIIKKTK